jgi:hypothetical protein
MQLAISSYEGVGPIKLGMSQHEVRNAVGSEFKAFMKTPASEMPTDNFVGLGIHVYYKKTGTCKAIEMFAPANPTFRGYRLMELPFGQLRDYFANEDPSASVGEYGLRSTICGIDLYVPDLDESADAPVKAVIVFERGYYNH